MATIFMESGTDATQGFEFWTATSGNVSSDSTVVNTGPRSIKLNTGNPAVTPIARRGGLTDAGNRCSVWINFPSVSPAALGTIFHVVDTTNTSVISVQLRTNGTVRVLPAGAPAVNGTTVLSTNTWYRFCLSYVITSTTNYEIRLYLNGVLEVTISTNGTLTVTGSARFRIILATAVGTNFIAYYDDIYIDDSSALTDVGNIRVTNKRPNANGTTNDFDTQIGSGGSGYGTGHSPQVNEQPLSITNGWSKIGAGAAVTEEFTIEAATVGDVNITGATIVDFAGWIYSKTTAAETAKMVLGGVQFNVSLTTTATLFDKFSGTTTYPAGGTDIGEITSTALNTVSLYECGILFAYIPSTAVKISNMALMGVGT